MMRIHILGIGGTFMGGLALLARNLGYEVSGSDRNIYPPMSTQLAKHGINVLSGYDPKHLEPAPDCIIVGNVMSRGNDAVEYMLDRKLPFISGPAWLRQHVLADQHVLAVAGTHGKTTTASLLCWLLECAGKQPGFLIGGIPQNYGVSARLGKGEYFVVEADEYDTAFFDKRAKFVHYRPDTLVINNIEFDHADIFLNLAEIKRAFHHVIRIVPKHGVIVANQTDARVAEVLEMGYWSQVMYFGGADSVWRIAPLSDDYCCFNVLYQSQVVATINWGLIGQFNAENALAAIAAAQTVGVEPQFATSGLTTFKAVKRRLECLAEINQITLYDDFAHHPTAIAKTLEALREKAKGQRIIAIIELRSNTMRQGVHQHTLATALDLADRVFLFAAADLTWDLSKVTKYLGQKAENMATIDDIVHAVSHSTSGGDQIVIMSNGDFSGLQQKLLAALKRGET